MNDDLAQLRSDRQWPALFSLAGVYPGTWTPVDSLVIQGDLTEQLDYTTTPLDYALLERTLGPKRTMAWFPVLPPNQQHPYDPGPYRHAGLVPLQPGQSNSTAAATKTARRAPAPRSGAATVSAAGATAASALLAQVTQLAQVNGLPVGPIHTYPDSNAWAANGPAVAGGRSMLAGDPHLPQTIPSIWYQVALSAPGYQVSGVSVPGLPGVLLGHNEPHRLVPHRHPEPGHAVLHRADQQDPARPVLLGRGVAADAPGALHDRGPRRRGAVG